MNWDEWRRNCIVALDYYWPSDNTSEDGSSAWGDPGTSSHDDADDWMSGEYDVYGWEPQVGHCRRVWDFTIPFNTVHDFKLMNYFWNFPFNIFGLQLTVGSQNHGKQNHG